MKTGHLRIDQGTEEIIIGSDECGYGCMAGPLVVGATAVPRAWTDPRVADSKAFKGRSGEARRAALFREFFNHPDFPQSIVAVDNEEIDRVGVFTALLQAHQQAITALVHSIEQTKLVVVDGKFPVERLKVDAPIVCLPKGDALVPACSLASVLAKVSRDKVMVEYDGKYPGYGFAAHRGYVTEEHQAKLKNLGPCAIHRRSYSPVRRVIEEREREEGKSEPEEAWMIFDE